MVRRVTKDARQRGCVLVIDDDDGVRRLLRTVLTVKELEVVEAVSGADAERRVAERRPDAIIIDLKSAETRGLDLLRRLRRRSDLERVPVILITGTPTESGHREALEAGADEVVTKPFGVVDLQQRVLKLLEAGRPRLRRTHREPRRMVG
jgi:two-component system, OmpR family, phosphate regulon response regulator PhoB